MSDIETFENVAARVRDFIARCPDVIAGSPSTGAEEVAFNDLAISAFQLQFATNPAYASFCQGRSVTPSAVDDWRQIPAVPTLAFKEWELSSIPSDQRKAFFQSSGTTTSKNSRHFHHDLSLALYEASLKPWFSRHLLADLDVLIEAELLGALDKLTMVALTPPPAMAPHSSLVYMLDVVMRTFGASDSVFVGCVDEISGWMLDWERLLHALRKTMSANRPVLILGTAFNFVHLVDYLTAHNITFRLARGSRAMETGGYKGRSRVLEKSELHGLISRSLGLSSHQIACEYGMCELSSQAYDGIVQTGLKREARDTSQLRVLHFPPWCRSRVISPETGQEVREGEVGLLRVMDLANVFSVCAVQTEDLAIRRGLGFELLGRAPLVEPRGCSLMSSEMNS
jgi:hypothetical protein